MMSNIQESSELYSAEVTDLYEAAYLLTEGGRIEGVRCIPLSPAAVSCCITVSAPSLSGKRETYQRKEAVVNLCSFRNAYTQVNGLMREAKKAWQREKRKGNEPKVREAQP